MKKIYFLLLLIILFFLVTRLFKLDSIPSSVYWDEASIGYNAYSITVDGKDEWGKTFPLNFRAFGEFKLPLYIYTVALFIKFLGLNEFSIRLPAVISSLITIILVFLIGKKLTGNYYAGLLAAFYLTISPWFFIFTRVGYEASLGVMFFCLGLYLYIKELNKVSFKFLSLLFLVLSCYTYNSFRVIVPFIFLLILFDLWRVVKKINRRIILTLAFLLVFIIGYIPIIRLLFSSDGGIRLSSVGIFSDSKDLVSLVSTFLGNYISYLNPFFLFLRGDSNYRSQQLGFGQLFLPDFIFLILGFVALFRVSKRYLLLIVFLILLSFIPGAITKESPHALRSISVVPLLSLVIATGILYSNKILKSKLILILTLGIYLALFTKYFLGFNLSYPFYSSLSWQYPYKQIFLNYKDKFSNYDKVIISDEQGQPYIFGLYYLNFTPQKFREEVKYNLPDRWGISLVSSYSNFIFVPNYENNFENGKLLVFMDPNKKVNLNKIGEIKNLDNSIAFNVYEKK